jgi:2,3-dihydroxyphenylpropionate 1,2-dioxygenase
MSHSAPIFGIVGAAIVPHAPQFLSRPETEDLDQVGRVAAAMGVIGERLRALQPDLVIVMSNSHADDYVVSCVPPFMVHCGDRAEGHSKHRGWWRLQGEAGYRIIEGLLDENFDAAFTLDAKLGTAFTIPLEFCGYERDLPFLPIFINAYVPPQPSPARCFGFGRALARVLERLRLRAVILASGGLSHYPGTAQYPHPDVATDRVIFERLKAGNLSYLMSFDAAALDRTGNVECRVLQVLAGAIGDRLPDSALFEPSWHHVYAVFGYTDLLVRGTAALFYPSTPSCQSRLAQAIFALVNDDEAVAGFAADAAAFAAQYDLAADQIAAFVALDGDALRDRFSINPMLTFQAKRRIAMAG